MESILTSRAGLYIYIYVYIYIISYEVDGVCFTGSFCFSSRYVHKEGRAIPLSIRKEGTWLIKSLLSLDRKKSA
jgi:hypothetical protein